MAKMGRPPADTAPVTIRMDRELLRVIDDFRRGEEDIPSRPEVVRRIVAQWFEKRKAEQE